MEEQSFQIIKTRENPGRRFIMNHTIVYLNSEKSEFLINDNSYFCGKGTIVILNPGDSFVQRYPIGGTWERYELSFDPKWLERVSDDGTNLMECFSHERSTEQPCVGLTAEQNEKFLAMVHELNKLFAYDPLLFGNRLDFKLHAAELLLFVNRLYRSNNGYNMDNKTLIYSDSVQKVSEYIRTNYWDDISIDSLSVKFRINRNQLCRQFKDLSGTSPIQYLINYRLSCACSFLSQGFSVEETCSKIGFSSLSHFSKTFKRKYGVSPKQYSKKGTA